MRSLAGQWRRTILLIHIWCLITMMLTSSSLSALDASPTPCSNPLYHQFDFWVGDWEVFDVGSPTKVAHARIDSTLNGCVFHEDYQAVDGHRGESFTIFDNSRNVWHQTWVTSQGGLLEIEGKFENGEMVLSGKDQQGAMIRGTWKPVNGEVREVAVKSTDGGKSWESWFDIVFRKSASLASADDNDSRDDRNIVAALDSQYQAAVKQNDAVTMGRILADDFVLVTSSGKIYTKAQLLKEARDARTIYEHQEDTDKTVRLWGDIAIVTAKLWEKGTEDGKPFDYKFWFSDVYRRTPQGWLYVFAQSAYRPGETIP